MTAAIREMTSGVSGGPTVSAGYASALADLAAAEGANRAALLESCGLTPADLTDPDARLPFAVFKQLMREGARLSGQPALALRFGASSPSEKLSIVGLIAHASATMEEAFIQTNRYGRLIVEVEGLGHADRFAIEREGDQTWLIDRRKNPNAFLELTESTWARFICENRRHHPDKPFAKAVHVPHAVPAYRAEYERILQAPVVFESSRNGLLIDPSWLSIPLGSGKRYVFGVFSRHAEALLAKLKAAETVRARVESLLIPVLHTGRGDMQATAARLGVSRASLHRRLKAEGTSFEAVLDDLRRRMALHYLADQKVSIAQTAYLVGFSEPSAFSRAFKRWTGVRPGEYLTGTGATV